MDIHVHRMAWNGIVNSIAYSIAYAVMCISLSKHLCYRHFCVIVSTYTITTVKTWFTVKYFLLTIDMTFECLYKDAINFGSFVMKTSRKKRILTIFRES